MCGFAGFVDFDRAATADQLRTIVRAQAVTLAYRGPDDAGEWVDPHAGVALGFRRLAIIDLSSAGHQPMTSASGRYVIVFNGEVYNASTLRQQLRGSQFRGHSDTEVMLAAIEAWGLHSATERFLGMFAFALWDRQERKLHLVRDRLGVKPLCYGWAGSTFLFGSELKSLRAHPSFHADIDRIALARYLQLSYIPAPQTIYRGFSKLLPGTILTVDEKQDCAVVPQPYWSARAAAEAGLADPLQFSDDEAVERLDELLRDAVGLRMIADVPLGVFLSGGIDSSIVTALMQIQSGRPVKTFSIGFHEKDYNEAHHAAAIAKHLGTDHTELYVTAAQAMAVIPKLPTLYDEPFADSSQIPTYLVAELARRSVTVSLSGDGGDELFGGYNRYFLARTIWQRTGWLPQFLRSTLAETLRGMSSQRWQSLFRVMGHLLPSSLRQRPGDKLAKLAEVICAHSSDDLYRRLVSHWQMPAAVISGVGESSSTPIDPAAQADFADFTCRMMYADLITYLPDDILVKVDRASMGVSLEAREPLLDHRLVEFAWRLPLHLKMRNGQGKWLLRQVLDRYVPRRMFERPKTGFGLPLDNWLRAPLRSWAEELLDERRLRREGFFDPKPIRQLWAEHLSGRRNWQSQLWCVLMFQTWLEQQVENSSSNSILPAVAA